MYLQSDYILINPRLKNFTINILQISYTCSKPNISFILPLKGHFLPTFHLHIEIY